MNITEVDVERFAEVLGDTIVRATWENRIATMKEKLEDIQNRIMVILKGRAIDKSETMKVFEGVFDRIDKSDLFRNCDNMTEVYKNFLDDIRNNMDKYIEAGLFN